MACSDEQYNTRDRRYPERDGSHRHINQILSSATKGWHLSRYSAQRNVNSDPEIWHSIRAVHQRGAAFPWPSDSGGKMSAIPEAQPRLQPSTPGEPSLGREGTLFTAETPAYPAVAAITPMPQSSEGSERKEIQNLYQGKSRPAGLKNLNISSAAISSVLISFR